MVHAGTIISIQQDINYFYNQYVHPSCCVRILVNIPPFGNNTFFPQLLQMQGVLKADTINNECLELTTTKSFSKFTRSEHTKSIYKNYVYCRPTFGP